MNDAVRSFKNEGGPKSDENIAAWNKFHQIFNADPWKSDLNDRQFKQLTDEILKQWKDWGGDAASFGTDNKATKPNGNNKGRETQGWHPEHAYRIDIHTNFNEDWYKKKFKSGLLNAALRAIRTDAMSHAMPDVKQQAGQDSMIGHKFTYDEMLPDEKKKLDSLQWKMTNKVAKMFISTFLGWSRKKEKYVVEGTEDPLPMHNLVVDEKFGKQMADKALNDRGLMGRLVQKTFSGGQANNVVSVAFQMADPNDGWTLVD